MGHPTTPDSQHFYKKYRYRTVPIYLWVVPLMDPEIWWLWGWIKKLQIVLFCVTIWISEWCCKRENHHVTNGKHSWNSRTKERLIKASEEFYFSNFFNFIAKVAERQSANFPIFLVDTSHISQMPLRIKPRFWDVRNLKSFWLPYFNLKAAFNL